MNKLLKYALIVIGFVGFLSSCQYKFNIEPTVPPPDPEEKISFAADVVPIWNTNNKCTSCHKTGSTSPDLTPDNAYNEIMNGYVDTDAPESSVIYSAPNPDTDAHNWGTSYTSGEAAIILQWIEQGALNN
jgi:hypothetical protein